MDNLDTALSSLRDEVNVLWIAASGEYKSKQIDTGHKLIAIRELLREKNGTSPSGAIDATGHRAPIGWKKWVEENLSIALRAAQICVHMAINPELQKRRNEAVYRHTRSANGILRKVRLAWPTWTDEDRNKFSSGLLSIMETA